MQKGWSQPRRCNKVHPTVAMCSLGEWGMLHAPLMLPSPCRKVSSCAGVRSSSSAEYSPWCGRAAGAP
eukprot:4074558-Prymnesium_polylepis.1